MSISLEKTENFIQNLDVEKYPYQGADYANPKYSPLRLGIPLEKIDITYDYDFARVAQLEEDLRGIDRRMVLPHIFRAITKDAKTNKDRHLQVLRFLQKSALHNNWIQPMYPDKTSVCDPLILLELGEMRCGAVARVAIDLFDAGGIRGRLVQAGMHVLSEIFYDNKAHFFEADVFSNGEVVTLTDGSIPSINELSKNPYLIDHLNANAKPVVGNIFSAGVGLYPSSFYFGKEAYAGIKPCFYQKIATSSEEQNSKYYGWENLVEIPNPDIVLYENMPLRYVSSAPFITQIEQIKKPRERVVKLCWEDSVMDDPNVAGYVIFISEQSRGWNYNSGSLPSHLAEYKSNCQSWSPEHYAARFARPRFDIARIKTTENFIQLNLPVNKDIYITVMSFDAHGQKVGRALYPMSEEIKLAQHFEHK